jgi:elongation factor G
VYRETIQKPVTITEKFDREIGGSRQRAAVTLKVTPLERGKGNSVVSELPQEKISPEFEDIIKEALKQGLESGVLRGYPMIDVQVILEDVHFEEGLSTEIACRAAASMGLNKACEMADPCLLEPIMNIEVIVPEMFMGDVIGDLNMRGGKVELIEPKGPVQLIKATAPLAKMFGYSTQLRSLTQGRGTFTMVFSHFDMVGN